jgi:hypothetical protein
VAHNPGFGTPIVMLPDPANQYDSDSVIDLLWRQFGSVLERATQVLVLGHGLNDQALVEILRTNVKPLHRLAVTVFGHPADPDAPVAAHDPVIARVEEELPEARWIPIASAMRQVHEGSA